VVCHKKFKSAYPHTNVCSTVCRKEKKRLYNIKIKDKMHKYHLEYYAKNKDELLRKGRSWHKVNRESILAKNKIYYEKNKDWLCAHGKLWRDHNKTRCRALAHSWEQRHKRKGSRHAAGYKRPPYKVPITIWKNNNAIATLRKMLFK
jgi:hypothetical protein